MLDSLSWVMSLPIEIFFFFPAGSWLHFPPILERGEAETSLIPSIIHAGGGAAADTGSMWTMSRGRTG